MSYDNKHNSDLTSKVERECRGFLLANASRDRVNDVFTWFTWAWGKVTWTMLIPPDAWEWLGFVPPFKVEPSELELSGSLEADPSFASTKSMIRRMI